jgi:hypothetical protein
MGRWGKGAGEHLQKVTRQAFAAVSAAVLKAVPCLTASRMMEVVGNDWRKGDGRGTSPKMRRMSGRDFLSHSFVRGGIEAYALYFLYTFISVCNEWLENLAPADKVL